LGLGMCKVCTRARESALAHERKRAREYVCGCVCLVCARQCAFAYVSGSGQRAAMHTPMLHVSTNSSKDNTKGCRKDNTIDSSKENTEDCSKEKTKDSCQGAAVHTPFHHPFPLLVSSHVSRNPPSSLSAPKPWTLNHKPGRPVAQSAHP
jgi:hypothetical protein